MITVCATAPSWRHHGLCIPFHSPSAVLTTTAAFDAYWRFASERLAIFYRRLSDPVGPWTDDPILRLYRFTNVFRATDRVTQYLIREVQYRPDLSQDPSELFFRTLLFKIFNRIDTWEALETAHGPISWRGVDLDALNKTLSILLGQGGRIYSAAYIMPSPLFGLERKHSNHLALIAKMMADRLPQRLATAPSLEHVYRAILDYPGLGPFLAFQYAIDLNYSTLLDFDESQFVVAGPGALDGISKCFTSTGDRSAEAIIHWVADRQEEEFAARGLRFDGLYGRRMQLIDCQNVFCEVSKYTRVSHPELSGVANRLRIKQTYQRNDRDIDQLAFPPRWNLKPDIQVAAARARPRLRQASLI
jgi:hypothetical protein